MSSYPAIWDRNYVNGKYQFNDHFCYILVAIKQNEFCVSHKVYNGHIIVCLSVKISVGCFSSPFPGPNCQFK